MVNERQTVDELIRYEETSQMIADAIRENDLIGLTARISIGHKIGTCWHCNSNTILESVNVTYKKTGISAVSEIYHCEECGRKQSIKFGNPLHDDKAAISIYFPIKKGE